MGYYCDVCDKYIKPKSKYKNFEPNVHKKLDKREHTFLSLKDIDINDVEEPF